MPILALPPGMLTLSSGLTGSAGNDRPVRQESNDDEWAENAETLHGGGFDTFQDAHDFLDAESAPHLAQPGNFRMEHRGGSWHIMHPRSVLNREWNSATGGMPAHRESAVEVESQNIEPNFHDPAHPTVTAWHNDIAHTVPVHPQALSKEHMQALADFEVHRRQHEKLEKQLHGQHDEYGDRPWVVSEEAQRRLDRSQERLNRLGDLAHGHALLASGTINPYQKLVRKHLYIPEDVLVAPHSPSLYRFDAEGARKIYGDKPLLKIPLWAAVDHRGRITDTALSTHPEGTRIRNREVRDRVLQEINDKALTAHRMSYLFGDPPEIDMSKVPITTYGKTRKRTGEWFSNLPPGMLHLDRDQDESSGDRNMSDAKQ